MPTRVHLRDPASPPFSTTAPSSASTSGTADEESGGGSTKNVRVGGGLDTPATSADFVVFSSDAPSRPFRIQDEFAHISSTDIVASPRLVGYLFCFTSSMVLMISSITFNNINIVNDQGEFRTTHTHSILEYKLYAAIIWGAVGCCYNFFIAAIHFDKRCLPGVWSYIFKDGSRGERNLLFFLMLFWIVGVHMCTSAYSVGNVQINVYFSSWFCLWSTFYTYEVWRVGADMTALFDYLAAHPRKTTVKWTAGLFFAGMTFGSTLDYYIEYTVLDTDRLIDAYALDQFSINDWIKGVAFSGAVALVCFLSLVINLRMVDSWTIPNPCYSPTSSCAHITVRWSHIELLFILAVIAISAGLAFEYTGVNGAINSPSNPYFGMWGMFFSLIPALGDWLGENKLFLQIALEGIVKKVHPTAAAEQPKVHPVASEQPQETSSSQEES